MEDWAKEFFEAVEDLTQEVDLFFQDVAEEVDDMVDEWVDFSENVSKQVREAVRSALPVEEIAAEFERSLCEWVEPIVDVYLEIEWDEEEVSEDADPFVPVTYVSPNADRHSACMGCKHYHGHRYGGNLLVCGMHPYGWEGESCPDWESDGLRRPHL